MTGDTTPISDEAITRLIKAFYEAHGVESWESSAEYRYGAEHHWMREALALTAPLLVSAEAERLREQRDNADMSAYALAAEVEGLHAELAKLEAAVTKLRATHADALARRELRTVVEGLRAELANEVELRKSYQREVAALRAAGGQEKPVCPLTEAGIEHRPHHYLTPVPWDCPGLPAAPVGGQHSSVAEAEPSDAAKHTIAWTLDANRGCIEGRITCHADPGDPCHRACRCEDASCYCGGATMEDIDFCNPLAFIENEDDVSLIERYDGADETLRDGPVELVWMPDGETYGWRYAAAAVSGEHRNQDGKTHQGPPENCRECAYEDGAYL